MESQELYKLNLVLQSQFPTIYDLIGGVEGLLMCTDKGDSKILDICHDREKLYDCLTGNTYDVLDAIADTESTYYGNDTIPTELDNEFVSWGFTDTLLKLSSVYKQILTDNMSAVLQSERNIVIINIMESPLKGVYYIQFDRLK